MRRLITIEPEVVQRAPSNRVRILVLRESFTAPRNRIGALSNIPGRIAVTLVIFGTVIRPTRFLRWCMKTNVTDVSAP